MPIPVKQENYRIAVSQGFEQAGARPAPALEALGAEICGDGRFRLPVLNSVFTVDLPGRDISFSTPTPEGTSSGSVGVMWQILALHYLCGDIPRNDGFRWVSFADFQEIRGYQSVYQGRVISRFCATAGRSIEQFQQAGERHGGAPLRLGDAAYHFQVFPRSPLRVVWYAGDGELPAGATILYPDNILTILPLEDVIVLSEGLVSRLQGKGWL